MHTAKILALVPLLAVATAAVNGHCSGAHATGNWKEEGICISTSTCNRYHGQHIDDACPYDGDGIKCCLIGISPNTATNPCGGFSACRWLDSKGHCPSGLDLVRGKNHMFHKTRLM
jgi:hypothetical protein